MGGTSRVGSMRCSNQFMRQSRWAPVTRPLAPTRAITSPWRTACPSRTRMALRCKKVEDTPWPWSRIRVRPEKNMSGWTRLTTPSAGATTGVPAGAAMSTP